MQNHIKVIIKEPGKAPYYDAIPNELEIFRKYVDGNIETVPRGGDLAPGGGICAKCKIR